MTRFICILVALATACAQPLPELPASDDGPTQIEILGLRDAASDLPVEPDAVFVGTPLRVQLALRTNRGPAIGSGLQLSIQQQDFLQRFRFPEGDGCTTDRTGQCSILAVSTGTAGIVTFTARSQARPDLSVSQEIVLLPDDRRLALRFDLGAAGIVEWQQGRVDPLPTAPPFSVISDGEAVPLRVQVLGQQGNPIAGIEVHAILPSSPEDAPVAVRLHPSDGSSCGEALGASDLVAITEGEDNWATLCLSGGERTGPWTLGLALPGRITEADVPGSVEGSFSLQGSTRSADPSLIRALEGSDAEPEPTARCEPGLTSPPIGFEVLDDSGRPASGVAVLFNANSLDLIGSPIQVTDASGRVQALVQCPVSLPAPVALQAHLVDQPSLQARVWVALWAQPVQQLIPRSGDGDQELGRAQPGQPFSVIIEARDRQSSLVADTRLDLTLVRWSGASELRLAQEGQCDPTGDALPEFLLTDGREEINGASNPGYGQLRLDLCAYGPATVARPMALLIKVHGQELRISVPILLEPGPPVTVTTEPAEQIAVLLGGSFGPLSVHVRDAAGNGVANTAVDLTAPEGLLIQPSSGFTDPLGTFHFLITAAERLGEHELTIRAANDEAFDQQTSLTVQVGPGTPQQIRLFQEGRRLVEQAGAISIRVPIGERLDPIIRLRLENEVGGGMAGLGLSVSAGADNPEGCGQIGPDGLVTDDQGEIILGGDEGVLFAAGAQVTISGEVHCEFDLEHGQLRQRLRVLQSPGPPVGGTLSRVEDDGPEQFLATQTPPAEFTASNSQAVRIRVTDALNNPQVGIRVWLNLSNCWASDRVQFVDANGEAVWRVAGGRSHARPCVLQAVTDQDWPQAPSLSLELDGYPLPELNGLQRSDPTNNGQGYTLTKTTAFSITGPEDSTRFYLDLAEGYFPIRPADLDGAAGPCFRAEQAEVGGDAYQGCTRAELWRVNTSVANDLQRTKIRDLPIDAVNENGSWVYFLDVAHSDVEDGRELEVVLIEPNGERGEAIPIFAHPPLEWSDVTGEPIAIPALEGADPDQIQIFGGQRYQLDDDPFLESVLCGVDDVGGWVQVLDQEGETYRFHGHRTWAHGPNPTTPYRAQTGRFACPLADLDGDGNLDLAQPTGTHADYLLARVAFLPGTEGAPFFGHPVEIPFTAGLINRPLIQLDITGPPHTLWFADTDLHGQGQNCSQFGAGVARCGSVALQHSPFQGDPETVFGQADLDDVGMHFARAAFDTAAVPGVGGVTTTGIWANSQFQVETAVYAYEAISGGYARSTGSLRPLRVPAEASGASIHLWSMSADHQSLAMVLSDNTVRFVDPITRRLQRTIQRPDEGHNRFHLTADQQTVVSTDGAEVLIWDLTSGLVFNRMSGYHPAIDPEGRWLFLQTGNERRPTLELYDLLDPEQPHASWLSAVEFPVLAVQPGGTSLAVTGCDNGSNCRIILLDRSLTPLQQWPGCFWQANVSRLFFSPDGNSLYCATNRGNLQRFDLDGQMRYQSAIAGDDGHISPLHKHGAWGGRTGCLIFRERDGQALQRLSSNTQCASPPFSSDGKWVASLSSGAHGHGLNLYANAPWAEGPVSPKLQVIAAGSHRSAWRYVNTERLLGQGRATDGLLLFYGERDLRIRTLQTWRAQCGNGRLDPGETVDDGQPWAGTGRDIRCGSD